MNELKFITDYRLENLRETIWIPRFQWVDNLWDVADMINKPHEDYPVRIDNTWKAIIRLLNSQRFPMEISGYLLQSIHQDVFGDKSFGGSYRKVNVQVGNHRCPPHEYVEDLMSNLITYSQTLTSISDIYKWYYYLESIHPFQDGNGRVGGIFVAAMSHNIDPKNGYLAPCQ